MNTVEKLLAIAIGLVLILSTVVLAGSSTATRSVVIVNEPVNAPTTTIAYPQAIGNSLSAAQSLSTTATTTKTSPVSSTQTYLVNLWIRLESFFQNR